MKRRYIFIFLCFFISGCTTTYKIGQIFNSAAVHRIVVGETTQQQIVQMIGPPLKVGLKNGDEVYVYSYAEVMFSEDTGPFQKGATVNKTGDTLIIEFDEEKRVKSYYFNVPVQEPMIFGLLLHEEEKKRQSSESGSHPHIMIHPR